MQFAQALPYFGALILAHSASAQAPFAAPEAFAENLDFARDIVTLDADLDGDDDVVACTFFDGAWYYESSGAAQARLGVRITEGVLRYPLVHDADGDGAPDIVGTLEGVGVVVFWNRAGRFRSEEVLAPGGLPLYASGFIDVDLDGVDDLILAGVAGSGIGWCQGSGSGGFGPSQALWSHNEVVEGATVVDLDADGDLDVIMQAESPPRLLAAINDQTPGSMSRVILADLPGANTVPIAGDLDGDGLPEVVIRTGLGVLILKNLGGAALSQSSTLGFVTGIPHLVDADRDGDLDLYIAHVNAGFYLNDGAGAFSGVQWLSPSGQGFSAAWGDQNGDGWQDLVTNAQSSYRLTWWHNDATGVAPFVSASFSLGGSLVSPIDLVVLDADADGDNDVVALDYASGAIHYFGTVGGRPTDAVRSPNRAPGMVMESLIAGDLDGDGFPDLVSTALNECTVWRGLGDGAFVATGTVPFSIAGPLTRIRPAELTDLDGDGTLDLLVSLSNGSINSPSEVVWRPGDGLGGFGAVRTIATSLLGPVLAPKVADIDGDGTLDVAAVISRSNQIRAWRGLGGGVFGPLNSLAIVAGAENFMLEDLDEDGDLDTVVLGGPFPYRLYWYPNGTSLGSGVLAQTPYATGFDFVDVDRNGRRDIVLRRRVANGTNDFEFAWLRRTSLTTFDPLESIEGVFEREPYWTLGDLDGDGDDDIIWTSSSATNPASPQVGLQRNVTLGEPGAAYCDAVPNSTGYPGTLRALGSARLALRSFGLAAHDLPPQVTVLFLAGRARANVFPVPSSSGRLCLGGAIGRFVGPGQVQNSGGNGEASLAVSLAALPSPQGLTPALAFDTWTFQAWHRDLVSGVPTSNFTSAVEVQFLP